jgi:hypothetical protein
MTEYEQLRLVVQDLQSRWGTLKVYLEDFATNRRDRMILDHAVEIMEGETSDPDSGADS